VGNRRAMKFALLRISPMCYDSGAYVKRSAGALPALNEES
jgi:hypothetical protein